MTTDDAASEYETLKRNSRNLRGALAEELTELSLPDVSEAQASLLAFHGVHQSYNRDTAAARAKAGLEPEYEFCIRLKCPAGRLTAAQFLGLDALADTYGNATLRLTPEQTIELYGVKKRDVKALVAEINQLLLSTFGAGGDVVGNIRACPAPIQDAMHYRLEDDAYLLAKHCTPKTKAYYELWLDGDKIDEYPFNAELDIGEPLYGHSYLPQGFSIALACPEDNCVDALTADLAIVPLFEGDSCVGYNLALGGGMGPEPRLAEPLLYVPPGALLPSVDAVIKLYRDHGERTDPGRGSFAQLVAQKGNAWIKQALEETLGGPAEDARAMPAFHVCDHMGWAEQGDGLWCLGIPIPAGRIADREKEQVKSGLRAVISEYGMPLVLTAEQNIILAGIADSERFYLGEKLRRFGIRLSEELVPLQRYAVAAAGLPASPRALAEAERIAAALLADIEQVLERYDMEREPIAVRIAAGPDDDARARAGDLGIIGCAPGHYGLYLGGNREGTRINRLLFDRVPLEEISRALDPVVALWKNQRHSGEGLGNFCHRLGLDAIRKTAVSGLDGYGWAG